MTDFYAETSPVEETKALPPKKRHFVPYLILAALFVLGICVFYLLPGQAQRITDPTCPWFSMEDGTVFFHPERYTGESTLIVPQQIAGQTVLHISDDCFAGCTGVITVELPDTLKTVGHRAFSNCTDLRGIFLPEGMTAVGTEAFSGCTSLESLCIPYNIRYIGKDAFDGCPKLIHIFYGGPGSAWKQLYSEPIAPDTNIYASDSTFKQEEIAS